MGLKRLGPSAIGVAEGLCGICGSEEVSASAATNTLASVVHSQVRSVRFQLLALWLAQEVVSRSLGGMTCYYRLRLDKLITLSRVLFTPSVFSDTAFRADLVRARALRLLLPLSSYRDSRNAPRPCSFHRQTGLQSFHPSRR